MPTGTVQLSVLSDVMSCVQRLLNLQDNKLGDDSVKALMVSMQNNSTVLKLYLDSNPFGDASCAAIGAMLAMNGTLKELGLARARIRPAGCEVISEALENTKQGSGSALERLDISWNAIANVGAMALLAVLETNQVSN